MVPEEGAKGASESGMVPEEGAKGASGSGMVKDTDNAP